MSVEMPGLVKAKEHLCKYLGSFPCGCWAISPYQLLSLDRCHHRKTLLTTSLFARHRHSWKGFQAVAPVRRTALHVGGGSYPPLPTSLPLLSGFIWFLN